MTSKLNREPLFAEVHNVPDDYHFTAEELDRIIAGDLFTPRQGAIMARELQERRKAERDSEPVAEVIQKLNGYDRPLYVVAIQGDVEEGDVLYRHAEQPVVPNYLETLPCPVLLEPGMRFGKGVKTRLVLDAIQRRAEHYAELEAMTPEERAEYDANIEAFKAMLPQPAPVVPEGLYKLANHIASSKNGLPEEWVNWAEELESEIRRAAMLQAGTLTSEDTRKVDELTMWIKRLVRSLKNANPDSKLPREAMDYLTAKGLISVGDILR